MSVVWVRETWRGRGGTFNYSFFPTDVADRAFIIRTNSLTDDEFTIGNSGMLPSVGSPHPSYVAMYLKTIDMKQRDNSPITWDSLAHYTDEPLKIPQDPNPLNRIARVRMKTIQYSGATLQDQGGNLIVNSAGEMPETSIDVDNVRWQIEVEKNIAYNQIPSWFNNLSQKPPLNSDQFTISQLGFSPAAKTCKLAEVELSDILNEQVDSVLVYYRVLKFSAQYDTNGWQLTFPDRGYHRLPRGEEATGTLYKIMVPLGLPNGGSITGGPMAETTHAVLLNGSGQPLMMPVTDSNLPVFNWTVGNSTAPYDVYPTMDFSQLPWS